MSTVKTICYNQSGSNFPDKYVSEPIAKTGAPESVSDKRNMQISSVFACMVLPAETTASLPFGVYQRSEDGGMKRNVGHQLDYLVSTRPWPTVTQHEFMVMMVMSMQKKGYAVAYIHRNEYKEPTGLEFIVPEEVSFLANEARNDFRVQISRYPDKGNKGVINPDDLLVLRNFSFDGIDGESTLWYASQATYLARAAEQTAQDFFSTGASISGYVATDQKLGDQRIKDLKASWRSNFGRGVGTTATIPVLDGGMKFHPVTIKPSEAQLLESRKFNAVDIARFFLMPPSKIYAGENKYNSQEQETLSYLSDKIVPMLDKIEQEFTYKLVPIAERGKTFLKFDEIALMRGDMKSMSEFYSKMFQSSVYSSDDIRRKLNEPTDPENGGAERFVMANSIPLRMATEYWEKNADNITVAASKSKKEEQDGKSTSDPEIED